MPLPTDHPFHRTLQNLLDATYSPDLHASELVPPPVAYDPTFFPQYHVAPNLLLKTIKPAPWITKKLALLCDVSIEEHIQAGNTFNPLGFPEQSEADDEFDRAFHAAEYYNGTIGKRCRFLSAKLVFCPNISPWLSFISPNAPDCPGLYGSFRLESGVTVTGGINAERPSPGVPWIPKRIRKRLADWVLPTIARLDRDVELATWDFFALTDQSINILKKMGPTTGSFQWRTPLTKGFAPKDLPERPADSSIINLFLPQDLENSEMKKPESHSGQPKTSTVTGYDNDHFFTVHKKVVIPPQRGHSRETRYRRDAAHFIQAAWFRSVLDDTTFIIFNCGKYERIGIRHRATQTLFLSDLIDPARTHEYGKIHLGLHLAILKDCIDRVNIPGPYSTDGEASMGPALVTHDKPSPPSSTGSKRRAESVQPEENNRSKRPKMTHSKEDKEIFAEEISKREIICLFLRYDTYHSPSPNSFIRIESSCVQRHFQHPFPRPKRKATYTAASYMTVSIHDVEIGRGASGVVYGVHVEVHTQSGEKLAQDMVLKLAMYDGDREKMLQEYSAYQHLARAGVTDGIVPVHGLFEDVETGMLVMLMDDAGKSLMNIYIEEAGERGEDLLGPWGEPIVLGLTTRQRDDFVRALDLIHGAHILHDDIRLENLAIDSQGNSKIIDFDLGVYDPSRPRYYYVREKQNLLTVLDPRSAYDESSPEPGAKSDS
ncbi:hypothetical protein CPC08DRAFT_822414 [Agrocybe pediades]|nr:hypothetical protein CPC08DRAFT_822414 [Agrocybe pediades]